MVREALLERADHRQQDVAEDRGPEERPDDVTGAIDHVDPHRDEDADHDAFQRRAPARRAHCGHWRRLSRRAWRMVGISPRRHAERWVRCATTVRTAEPTPIS